MLLLAISLFVAPARTSRHTALAPIAIALGAVALVLTFSRGAWLAFAVALVVTSGVVATRSG